MSWLKKHWKWLLFPVGLLFLALTIYGRFSRPTGSVEDVAENILKQGTNRNRKGKEEIKAYSAKVDALPPDKLDDELNKAIKDLREEK